MYLVPLASHQPIPPELLPFDGPGKNVIFRLKLRLLQAFIKRYFFLFCLRIREFPCLSLKLCLACRHHENDTSVLGFFFSSIICKARLLLIKFG